jgi:hypothetical protein
MLRFGLKMKPLKFAKAMALSFLLGAILSAASDPTITRQVQAIALSQAQAIASSAMRSLSRALGHGLEQGLRGIVEQFVRLG